MIPSTAAQREASLYSHAVKVRVDIYRNGASVGPSVPVVEGSVEQDRGSKVRWSSDVTLAMEAWEATGIDAKVCRFKVWRGLDVLPDEAMTQLGEYRVDEVTRDEAGLVKLTGTSLETYVVDARFITPRTPPYGVSTVDHIMTLIREAVPDARFVLRNTRNKPVQATAPWERERWDAVDALAKSIDVEVYCNHTGAFVIADAPLVTDAPVFIFDEGEGGALVDQEEGETRARVYNAVSVSSASSDPAVPPVWGWAYDDDPTSPTYFYGAFGQVPRFFESQFFTTEAQCTNYARSLLAESLAENKTVSFRGLQLDTLEVGDVAGVRRFDGTVTTHLLQSLSSDLGTKNVTSAKTLSAKSVIADGV